MLKFIFCIIAADGACALALGIAAAGGVRGGASPAEDDDEAGGGFFFNNGTPLVPLPDLL